MFRVALTGGIASGKSTTSELFAQQGIEVIDADLVSRELVEPGQPALQAIGARFGDQVIDAHGCLDRATLRKLVFDHPEQRRALEDILHPLIRQRIQARAAQARSAYVLLVIPLLVEGGHSYDAHRVLVVDAPESLQLVRLQTRDGSSPEQARHMLDAQTGRDRRLAAADDVISNQGSADSLAEQVAALHRRYLALARHTSAADAERVRRRLASLARR